MTTFFFLNLWLNHMLKKWLQIENLYEHKTYNNNDNFFHSRVNKMYVLVYLFVVYRLLYVRFCSNSYVRRLKIEARRFAKATAAVNAEMRPYSRVFLTERNIVFVHSRWIDCTELTQQKTCTKQSFCTNILCLVIFVVVLPGLGGVRGI